MGFEAARLSRLHQFEERWVFGWNLNAVFLPHSPKKKTLRFKNKTSPLRWSSSGWRGRVYDGFKGGGNSDSGGFPNGHKGRNPMEPSLCGVEI
jgi:hypothetical protein